MVDRPREAFDWSDKILETIEDSRAYERMLSNINEYSKKNGVEVVHQALAKVF